MESTSSANISCIQDSWASNSLGQNPCEIAERLNSVCTTSNDSYFVELTSEDDYTLSAEDQNPCLCTSVVYNLVSMCRLCQTKEGKIYSTWSQWTTNCSSLNTGFPPGLPGGTAVPDWAYQDISESDAFNETLALNVATTDHSESSSSALPSSTSTSSATSTPNTQISRDSDDDVAALVGGLLGGLVGLALIVVAILYLIRRRSRSRMAPSIAYLEANRKKEDLARGRYAPVNALRTERVSDLPYNISGDNHSSFSFNPYDTSFANTGKDPTQ